MRVLISRLSALGDVACSLPAAGSLKSAFPESEITWLVDRRFSQLVECCDFVDHVVVSEKKLPAMVAQVKSLGEFDLALDLQGLLKSALPVCLVKASKKGGYHWQREGARFLVSPVLPAPSSLHVVEQYCDVARAFGGSDEIRFGLSPKADDLVKMREVLTESGVDLTKPLVISNAGAGWAAKRWLPENYARLVQTVSASGGQVAFIGTKADLGAFEAVIAAGGENAVNLISKSNVRELVALLSMANVVVAGDTGALHIAAGLGRPCVGIYTQTNPERSGAYGQLERCQSTDVDVVSEQVVKLMRGEE